MLALAPTLLWLATGCALPGGFTPPWKSPDPPKVEGPKDQVTLTSGGMKHETIDSAFKQELEGAKRLFEDKKYAEAEPIFHKLAYMNPEPKWWEIGLLAPSDKDVAADPDGYKPKRSDKKHMRSLNPIIESALFYEAECQRMQKNYRAAVDTYTKLLTEVQHTQYTQRVCQGLFEIADYWLEPTRRQMDEYQDQLKGKRWFVTPAIYFHFTNEMPFLDAEGSAIAVLNTVRLHDIRGPLGEKSLLYLGTINFFRQDYKEADFYFTELKNEYKDGPYAAKAVKQSVICKQLMTGGSVYDCRGLEESKKLLMKAQGWYPELAKDQEWIGTQLASINIQQADRDWRVAEFYRRTGHSGPAYFYYELVIRRYPGTTYADKAREKKAEIKAKVEKEEREAAPGSSPTVQDPGMFVPPPPRTLPQGLDGRD